MQEAHTSTWYEYTVVSIRVEGMEKEEGSPKRKKGKKRRRKIREEESGGKGRVWGALAKAKAKKRRMK
jgi:hypothetical protein